MGSSDLLNDCIKSAKDTKAYEYLRNLIENEQEICKDDLTSANYGRSTKYKKGIYFAYKNSEIVYVGKVGDTENTSLYDRFKGHGSGSHKFDYDKVKFHRFEELSDTELLSLESMFIMTLQPECNKQF